MDANRRVIAAWREALRNLLPLALAALVIVAIYVLLARWADYSATPATNVASYLTLKLRKPVKPSTVLRVFNVALWLVRWVVIPVFLLPMLSATAARGWHGFGAAGALARKWLYWIEAPVLLLCAIWVPSKLLGWVPGVDGFSTEMASFVLRAGVAYLFFVTAGLVLAFVTSGGKPPLTQPSTVASP